MKRALYLLLGLLAGCVVASQPPQVVTVTSPYAALLPITDTSDHSLGRTACDLAGQPFMLINLHVRADYVPYVLLHERIHIVQMRSYPGGCFAYRDRYTNDEAFRLSAEAEAFCGVYEAQVESGVDPLPDLDGILTRLMYRSSDGYDGHWSIDQAKAAMRCWKPPNTT